MIFQDVSTFGGSEAHRRPKTFGQDLPIGKTAGDGCVADIRTGRTGRTGRLRADGLRPGRPIGVCDCTRLAPGQTHIGGIMQLSRVKTP